MLPTPTNARCFSGWPRCNADASRAHRQPASAEAIEAGANGLGFGAARAC